MKSHDSLEFDIKEKTYIFDADKFAKLIDEKIDEKIEQGNPITESLNGEDSDLSGEAGFTEYESIDSSNFIYIQSRLRLPEDYYEYYGEPWEYKETILGPKPANVEIYDKQARLALLTLRPKHLISTKENQEIKDLWQFLKEKGKLIFISQELREVAEAEIGFSCWVEDVAFSESYHCNERVLISYLSMDISLLQSDKVIEYIKLKSLYGERKDKEFLEKIKKIIFPPGIGRGKKEKHPLERWQLDWVFIQIFYRKRILNDERSVMAIAPQISKQSEAALGRRLSTNSIKTYYFKTQRKYFGTGGQASPFLSGDDLVSIVNCCVSTKPSK